VGDGRLLSSLRRAALEHDNRLPQGERSRNFQESPRSFKAFEVDQDGVRLRIVRQVVQGVGLIDIDLVPQPDDPADAKVLAAQDGLHRMRGEVSGLGDY
jgi:hypothetical protein